MDSVRKERNLDRSITWGKLDSILVLIICLLMVGTFTRNETWGSKLGLWRDCVAKSPHKTRPYINLSAVMMEVGMFPEAEETLTKALKIDDKDYCLYYNLGIARYLQHNLVGAYAPAYKAVVMKKDTMTMYQLGLILRDYGWKPGMPNPGEERQQ